MYMANCYNRMSNFVLKRVGCHKIFIIFIQEKYTVDRHSSTAMAYMYTAVAAFVLLLSITVVLGTGG